MAEDKSKRYFPHEDELHTLGGPANPYRVGTAEENMPIRSANYFRMTADSITARFGDYRSPSSIFGSSTSKNNGDLALLYAVNALDQALRKLKPEDLEDIARAAPNTAQVINAIKTQANAMPAPVCKKLSKAVLLEKSRLYTVYAADDLVSAAEQYHKTDKEQYLKSAKSI
jgi:hypothetical protein